MTGRKIKLELTEAEADAMLTMCTHAIAGELLDLMGNGHRVAAAERVEAKVRAGLYPPPAPSPAQAPPADAAAPIDLGLSWRAVLAPLDEPDPHGRVLAAPFALRFTPPKPLLYPPESGESVMLGVVSSAAIVDGTLTAAGRFVVADRAAEVCAYEVIDRVREGQLVPAFDLTLAGDASTSRLSGGALTAVVLRESRHGGWAAARMTIAQSPRPAHA